jgi:tRNA(Arg) A34 adenosine deaminase TadA
MSCAKKRVLCILITEGNELFIGENWCNNPQPICPRAAGEDYSKCQTICRQPEHAEIAALRKAGNKAKGSTVLITHNRICKDCAEALNQAGVKTRILV